jgi:hypothetical protein
MNRYPANGSQAKPRSEMASPVTIRQGLASNPDRKQYGLCPLSISEERIASMFREEQPQDKMAASYCGSF